MDQETLIVVVDDDASMLDSYARVLRGEKYAPRTFSSVSDAIKFLETTKQCSLIISDYNMLKMNGLDFWATVREDPRYVHTPFMMISASDEAERLCVHTDVIFYRKPVPDLIEKVKKALGSR
jgi:two-component system sensor histidine kinase/response regulator